MTLEDYQTLSTEEKREFYEMSIVVRETIITMCILLRCKPENLLTSIQKLLDDNTRLVVELAEYETLFHHMGW